MAASKAFAGSFSSSSTLKGTRVLKPTALSLPPGDVRRVVDAGKKIFRQSPELARLLKDMRESR